MINEHELKLVNEMSISIYRRGYEDGVVETEKINDKAHDDGYNKGLYDAWECARKLMFVESKGGLSVGEHVEIFGNVEPAEILKNHTASEVIAKIKEYEDKQKKIRPNCSYLNDICPYDIKCVDCEVHCSLKRARNKIKELKGDKE